MKGEAFEDTGTPTPLDILETKQRVRQLFFNILHDETVSDVQCMNAVRIMIGLDPIPKLHKVNHQGDRKATLTNG